MEAITMNATPMLIVLAASFAVLTFTAIGGGPPSPIRSAEAAGNGRVDGFMPGGYRVQITSVTDGDTFRIDANPWIKMPELARISVRVDGIDTPEKGGNANCEQERRNAAAATAFTKRMLLESGNQVALTGVRWDKYGGRILAKVELANGEDLSAKMIEMGYAMPYDGKGAKTDWCAARPAAIRPK
jgi:endonuclease YncB( thermonuclease family)